MWMVYTLDIILVLNSELVDRSGNGVEHRYVQGREE